MTKYLRIALLAGICCGSWQRAWGADEWPQFRGPSGQGHADARALPASFGEAENLTWKVPLPGRGWSSPVISGEQIWMTAAKESPERVTLHALCIDRKSGQLLHDLELFKIDAPPTVNSKNSYASPTPVLEQGKLYVHFGTFGTACIATDTGQVLWKNESLKLDHKEGPGSSPMVWNDLLLINCDGMDVQFVVALNKVTGEIVWKTDRSVNLAELPPDLRKAYCTPLVIEVDGQSQLISPGAGAVVAYDPRSGKELWQVRYPGFSNVPRPVFGHGLVYVCTGYMKPQLWAINPRGSGDITETNVVWKSTKQISANPSPVLVEDQLFVLSDNGVVSCLDALGGKEQWVKRLGGNYSVSVSYADGKLFFASEDGRISVARPDNEYQELASIQLEARLLASPAFADSAMFWRSETHLYRFETPAAAQQAAVGQ